DVADAGHEPDQRIEAEAHAGAGDDERGVEQGRERVDAGNAGGAGTPARKVEAIRGGHGGPSSAAQMGMRGGERKRSAAGFREETSPRPPGPRGPGPPAAGGERRGSMDHQGGEIIKATSTSARGAAAHRSHSMS